MENKNNFNQEITLRPLEEKDRLAVLNISAEVWEGTDYVPNVLDQWLKQEKGVALGLFDKLGLQGFAKLSFINETTAWMEGIRVAKASRGKGYGKILTDALVEIARKKACTKCQLSSFIENYESLQIIKKKGFVEKWAYKYMEFDAGSIDFEYVEKILLAYRIRCVKKVEGADFDALVAHLKEAEGTQNKGGYWSFDWTFKAVDENLVKALLEVGGLYAIETEDAKVMAYFGLSRLETKGPYQTLHFVSSQKETPVAVAFMVKAMKEAGENFASYMAPKGAEESVLKKMGYVILTDSETDAYLFEKGITL